MLRNFLIRLIINAIALVVAAWAIPGIHFDGNFPGLLVIALVFGVVNAIIKPIVTLLTCPLVALTLGLFTLVINALMLWLTGWLAGVVGVSGFQVDGFWPAFLGAIVISIVSLILSVVLPEGKKRR